MNTKSHIPVHTKSHPEPIAVENGDLSFPSFTSNDVVPQHPAKKPTRQWAAWTHEEEESFFNALRQVGKDFDKITCRVQSKNKDQVRHYYYRLVRRMNKLLGPGLCLDAKNSRDANAAMLRWWSLLEKYSCKASKLHLKPRRFKIFIEALELQLLKDRKKNIKKRLLQGENCPPSASGTFSDQSRASGNDARSVRLVLVDSQNIQKFGPTKASFKRHVNTGVNCTNNKGESTISKPSRQRRRTGTTSPNAHRKWEKAAIAGVSLVADAAEHLERTVNSKILETDSNIAVSEQKCITDVGDHLTSLPACSKNIFVDNNAHNPAKLKLQLFPIDDGTQRALEMDKHNPYLELTLSTKKKISSVLQHLNKKWGNSSIAVGELMLLPYTAENENSIKYQRWTQDSILSAADVYTILGSPQRFRLRYGWFFDSGVRLTRTRAPMASSCILGESNNSNNKMKRASDHVAYSAPTSVSSANDMPLDFHEHQVTSMTRGDTSAATLADLPSNVNGNICLSPADIGRSTNMAPDNSCSRNDDRDERMKRQTEDTDEPREIPIAAIAASEWADSLGSISVGDLLSGVTHDTEAECVDPPIAENANCMHQVPFFSDSFDAAIAAHISRQQEKMASKPVLMSSISSMWDGEETCDAFSFKKDHFLREDGAGLSTILDEGSSNELHRSIPECYNNKIECMGEEVRMDNSTQVEPNDEYHSDGPPVDNSAKDFNSLADVYWPDSLGPLDLDLQSPKYHCEDMILSDSLSGLNRLIASSLDEFQNCSFFELDKREASWTVEPREIASFSNVKIGSDV